MGKALIVADKKKILVRDDHPTRITTVIPTSKIVNYRGTDLVVVPHELDEVKVLNNMGYNIQSPISTYYHWPSRYPTPMIAQSVTANNLTLDKRHFVLNEIGTGKTLSALWAFDYLRSIGRAKCMLVVTPLSTMESVWSNEVWEHLPHLSCQVLYGTAQRRVSQLEFPADIYVINHDGLKVPEIMKALLARKDIDVLCVDELADFKNSSTDRFKALKKLSAGRTYFWGMTGTPIPNKVTDAWAQCMLISPDKVPPYFGRFRDMVMRQVSQFKWVPRDNALDVVRDAMQPATLFRRDECVDLPPTMYEHRFVEMTTDQKKAYKEMMLSLVAEAEGGQIVAVNEAVKMGKLVQIACIAKDTPVLSKRGWVPIQEITEGDVVWDGVEWVSQDGAIKKGVSKVIDCGGVMMTEDHLVLSTRGWKRAEEMVYGDAGEGFDWHEVRVPDSSSESGFDKQKEIEVRNVEMSVRLRERGCQSESVPTCETQDTPAELRVSSWKRFAQDDANPSVRSLVKDEVQVSPSVGQRLEELRRKGNNCVRGMAGVVSEILGRHARRIQTWADSGPRRQFEGIQRGQLPMGYRSATGEQPAHECSTADTRWSNECVSSSSALRHSSGHAGREVIQIRMAAGKSAPREGGYTEVFDIANCGPRNRFVVRGSGGELRIVHNCGVAYNQHGEPLRIDSKSRIDELKTIIEASQGKVIVFIPLTGGLHSVAEEIGKEWQTEVVYGDVSKKERDRIFSEFKQPGGLHVLVAHPRCMSHGLTLVEANTVVWFIPTNNNNEYVQANGRVTRPGQKRNTFIIHIEGSDVERRMYKRLKEKGDVQGVLLEMIKESTIC